MTMISEPIRTISVYDVSDDDVAPVQAPDHLLLPPDAPPIAPDLLDIKNCTRQLELYNRVCMEFRMWMLSLYVLAGINIVVQ